jgi:BlaI family transcriptional regulator, penicillinase repressor
MSRPRAKELTERELEIMHVFWRLGALTAAAVREDLAQQGRELAYTTVATLVRILTDKEFLKQTNTDRPFVYLPVRSFEDVSGSLLSDMVDRVFSGSRKQLLLRLMEDQPLSAKDRKTLEGILKENK